MTSNRIANKLPEHRPAFKSRAAGRFSSGAALFAFMLLVVLLLAALLRFHGLAWDEGKGAHPDERRIEYALEELSPHNFNPRFFAYGTFPIYLQRIWQAPVWNRGFEARLIWGRYLSAAIGVLVVLWTYLLAANLVRRDLAVWAAAFMAIAVLPIQHSHFITFDSYQALLCLMALEAMIRGSIFGPIFTGLAIATKVSSLPLLLPLVIATGFSPVSLLVAAGAFVIGEPYFLDPQYLHDVREQSQMVRTAGSVPYTVQYMGTIPYLYESVQLFWGMGPLALAALAGGATAAKRIWNGAPRAEIIVFSFFAAYLLLTGWFPVKFMRYLLPVYPIFAIYAVSAAGKLRPLIFVTTLAYALVFSSIYFPPHTWIEASCWIYANIPPGSTILEPHWDDNLPLSLESKFISQYKIVTWPLYDDDSADKTDLLSRSDYVIFPTNRLPGALTIGMERYPKTARMMWKLLDGELGYVREKEFSRLRDDLADESFSVYDHPRVTILRNASRLTNDQIKQRLAVTKEELIRLGIY